MSIVGPPSQVDWNAARHAILHLRKYMVFHNMPQLLEFILCYAHIFCPRTFFLQPSVVQTNFFSGGKAKYDLVKLDVEYGGTTPGRLSRAPFDLILRCFASHGDTTGGDEVLIKVSAMRGLACLTISLWCTAAWCWLISLQESWTFKTKDTALRVKQQHNTRNCSSNQFVHARVARSPWKIQTYSD